MTFPAPQPGHAAPQYPMQPAPWQPPVPRSTASLGARVGAAVIDYFVFMALMMLGAIPGIVLIETGVDELTWTAPAGMMVGVVLGIIHWIAGDARGQTLGRRISGIRVVHAHTGAPLGAGRGAVRWMVFTLLNQVAALGAISILINDNRRGWHESASESITVPARPRPGY